MVKSQHSVNSVGECQVKEDGCEWLKQPPQLREPVVVTKVLGSDDERWTCNSCSEKGRNR